MKRCPTLLLLLACLGLSAAEVKIEKNYFRPNEKSRLTVRKNAADEKIDLHIRNFYGEIRTIDSATTDLPTDENGCFEIVLNGKEVTSYAVVPAPPPRNTEKNPFGVNFHLLRFGYHNAVKEIELAKFIGIDWGRGMLPAFSAMKSPDFANEFKRYSQHIELVKKSGIHPLVTITDFPVYLYGKKWNRRLSLTAPEDMSCLTDFCKAAAKAMPFARHWEIGNETDTESFWLGRRSSAGNDRKIIQDYVDMLAAAGKGFEHTGVKLHYSGVTSYKEGSSYRPFLTTTMELGAQKYYNVMGAHYGADIPYIRSVMRKFKAPEVPVWITEIGSTAYDRAGNTFSLRNQLRTDVIQQIEQIADGAEKVFKYNFRDKGVKKNDVEANFGLIRYDFSPKPGYVAEATLIRRLANADFAGDMNIMKNTSSGWLRAYLFKEGSRETCIIWLNSAKTAEISLYSSEKELLLTDIMGRERRLPVKDGKVSLRIDDLPFFITGKLIPNQGKPEYPKIVLLREFPVKLKNSGFETPDISVWENRKRLADDIRNSSKVRLSRSSAEPYSGAYSLEAEALSPAGHYVSVISQRVDLAEILKQMKPGDFLIVKAECMMKRENSAGRGSSFEVSCFDSRNRRIKWFSNGYRNGAHPWQKQQHSPQRLPPAATSLAVGCFFAPDTIGRFFADDVKLTLELWGEKTEQQEIPVFE